ncbi:MAG: hypothetical protein IPH55_11825 [Betaproteobacteria bacterium]|nr:hypothetical protein [Betaproteobacteria bacterium]
MNATRFRAILAELIDENPFAIRAVLRILGVEFTTAVPTLAVTCEERPRLLVNLDFVTEHCRSDAEVKALLCHEFLHVLLRHTEARKPFTPARHLALDAVINAIIHREHGPEYTALMSRYYADAPGLDRLLRPMNDRESAYYLGWPRGNAPRPAWVHVWQGLYAGTLLADDIEALAEQMGSVAGGAGANAAAGELGPFTLQSGDADFNRLLGNHDDPAGELPDALKEALDRAMKEMNGSGIWRAPKERGIGANPYEALVSSRDEPMERWQRRTLAVLREHLLPDSRSRAQRDQPTTYRIPVLSPRDRRAFLRAQWSPFLPEALWEGTAPRRDGSAHVYLDVSGSMNAEMPLVIALLARVSRWIRRPFWAFSDVVAPAVIERGQLKAQTTGGTSMRCVLEHVARTRPAAAIVLTDGYIETLDRKAVQAALAGTRLTALITRDGNPAQLKRAGIPYTQLDKVPA